MRKIIICVCAVLILFSGCAKNNATVSEVENADGIYGSHLPEEYKSEILKMKEEFAANNENLTKEEALAADMTVITGNTAEKSNKIKEFCDSVVEKNPSSVRIAIFNKDEKNVIIKNLKYDGKYVYGYFDMHGYSYSDEEYLDFAYPYCELYEQAGIDGKINYMMYLTETNDYTLDEIMNIVSDSDDGEMKKCVYVCSYTE